MTIVFLFFFINQKLLIKSICCDAMQIPVLEHNGNIIAESLDLLSYLDANFEGPKLFPGDQDPAKQAFADELIANSDSVITAFFKAGRAYAQGQGDDDISKILAPALDKVEESLGRFSDGPFLLGQSMSAVSKLINDLLVNRFLISFEDNNRIAYMQVDMVYAPFVERFKDFFAAVKHYDITQARPKLKEWIEVCHCHCMHQSNSTIIYNFFC